MFRVGEEPWSPDNQNQNQNQNQNENRLRRTGKRSFQSFDLSQITIRIIIPAHDFRSAIGDDSPKKPGNFLDSSDAHLSADVISTLCRWRFDAHAAGAIPLATRKNQW